MGIANKKSELTSGSAKSEVVIWSELAVATATVLEADLDLASGITGDVRLM